jgi:hypothetical protein
MKDWLDKIGQEMVMFLTIVFLAVSIVAIVRGRSIWLWFVDRVTLIKENGRKDDIITDLRADNAMLNEAMSSARMTSDIWRGEITALNATINELRETTIASIARVERKLGYATGFIVELIEYIDEHPTDRPRPQPPFEIRDDVDQARKARIR